MCSLALTNAAESIAGQCEPKKAAALKGSLSVSTYLGAASVVIATLISVCTWKIA